MSLKVVVLTKIVKMSRFYGYNGKTYINIKDSDMDRDKDRKEKTDKDS